MIVSIPTLSMSILRKLKEQEERGSVCAECVCMCVCTLCVCVCGGRERDGEIGHTKEILSTFLHIFISPEKTKERVENGIYMKRKHCPMKKS